MALVELARFSTSFEAGLARSVLEGEGIQCFIFDSEMQWSGLGMQSRLMVDDEDAEEAARILAGAGDDQPR
jgi:hypothetical protein